MVCDVGNRSCPVTYVPGSKGGSCAHTWHVHATWSSAQSINKRVRTVFNNRSIKHKKQNRSVKTQSNNNQSEIHLPTPAPLWTTELGVRLKWHSLGCNVLASSFSTFIVMTRGAVRVTSTEIGGATKEEKNGFEYKELQLQLFYTAMQQWAGNWSRSLNGWKHRHSTGTFLARPEVTAAHCCWERFKDL